MSKHRQIGLEGVSARASRVATFTAGGAIAAGAWVRFDTAAAGELMAETVVTGAADGLCIGVALEAAAAAGDPVTVCIGGYCDAANLPICAAGNTLVAAAAGTVSVFTAAETRAPVGVALVTLAAPAVGACYIFDKGVQV